MGYFPVNIWRNIGGGVVRFAFTYNTEDEAREYGKQSAERYGDHYHTGMVVQCTDPNDGYRKATELMDKLNDGGRVR